MNMIDYYSTVHSSISPGEQSSALQMASNVEKRIAFALPVLRIERLARVIPTLSDNSLSDILRLASITSKFTLIITVRLSNCFLRL